MVEDYKIELVIIKQKSWFVETYKHSKRLYNYDRVKGRELQIEKTR